MDDVNKRFVLFKISILKFSILLVFIFTFFFFLFHIFFDKNYILASIEFFLISVSLYFYKFISIKNYKFYAIMEFFILLISFLALSIVYPYNVYLPIWMFGTLIVFTFCTDLILGIIFLMISMVLFDIVFFKRLEIYSFLTLNLQFIAYFTFVVILIKKIEALQKETFTYEKMLFEFSTTDVLTQLFNRRYFEKTAKILLEKAKRNNTTVFFMILDIDYFKKINDTYGHPVGDFVLKKVAKGIENSIRKSDLLGRVGGEEFAILIDDCKDCIEIAEKIRKNISKLDFEADEKQFNVTISIGGVVSKNYNYEHLYKKADEALYEAKRKRDEVVIIKC